MPESENYVCSLCGGIFVIARKVEFRGKVFCERCAEDARKAVIVTENERYQKMFDEFPLVSKEASLAGISKLRVAASVTQRLEPFCNFEVVEEIALTYLERIGIKTTKEPAREGLLITLIAANTTPGLFSNAAVAVSLTMEIRKNMARVIMSSAGPIVLQQNSSIWEWNTILLFEGTKDSARKALGSGLDSGLSYLVSTFEKSRVAWKELIENKQRAPEK